MTEDLEQLVRDGLRRRAENVDTTVPLVGRAQQAVRRRRGTRAGLALAAAVAVGIGGVAVLDRPEDVSPVPAPAGPTRVVDPTAPAAPTTWRTEQWRDLAVDVPADWAYGAAPTRSGRLSVVCGDTPSDVPYVGRPIMTSDRCMRVDFLEPTAPYVWLGADVEPGTVRVGKMVQETVEVAGTTLTVAGDDVLRRRIFASARTGGTCPTRLEGPPADLLPLADTGSGLQVCAYRSGDGVLDLVGSELRDAASRRRFVAGYVQTFTVSRAPSCGPAGDEIVLLQAGRRQWVVDLACSGIREIGSGPSYTGLVPAAVRPWSAGVAGHVLYGPAGGKGATLGSFIGPQG